MKPTKVIIESKLERELREERARETDGLLAQVERAQEGGARWEDARQMLGWYFAMYGRMEGAPAIDPAREVVQGLQVDRDERIHQLAYVSKALRHLARVQGNDRGVLLLWLHFRAPSQVGETRDDDGRKRGVYGLHSLAVRDLHREAGGGRNEVIREFWEAMRIVEEYALNRRWVANRLERRGGATVIRVYRREEPSG